jgi:tetratricopeptide (TPR) repeat protein
MMPYSISTTSKIFTSLSLVLTLVTAPTAQAAFWAQQQTNVSTPASPVKTASAAVKQQASTKVLHKPANKLAKPAASLTFDDVLKQTDHLVDQKAYPQAIKVWQNFLHTKNITQCQNIYANYSLGKLYIQQEQYGVALKAFDTVLLLDPVNNCNNVDYTVADTLDSKGYVLVKLNRKIEGLEYFKFVPQLYKNSKNQSVNKVVLSSLSNIAEISLIVGQQQQALAYAKRANKLTAKDDDIYAIMPFLLWLMNNKTEQDVLKAINNLSPDTDYSWDWRDIPSFINQLPAKRQAKANCFIDFFNHHHDKARVKACLAQ